MSLPSTPHIRLNDEIGFGKTVLMPGDPNRAKLIAEKFFKDPVLVNDVRGVNGYTGYFEGIKVSVMASGMGIPSIGIYSEELYRDFGVENIIRVGSIGAISNKCDVGDLIAATSACTNSSFLEKFNLRGTIAPAASAESLRALFKAIDETGYDVKIGPVFSTDTFYSDSPVVEWGKIGCLGVEMESAALYANAMRYDKNAMFIGTVSDLCYPPFTSTDAEEREKNFVEMTRLALTMAKILE